jgi:hypothetical protein
MARYIVAAGYVTVQTAVPGGRAAIDVPRGALLPEDVPAEEFAALLASGAIVVVPEQETVAPVAGPAPAVEPAPRQRKRATRTG